MFCLGMPFQSNENLMDIDIDEKRYDSTRSLVKIFWEAWVRLRRETGEKNDEPFTKCVEIMKINGETKQVSSLEYWVQMNKEVKEQQQDCSYPYDALSDQKIWRTFTVALEYPTNEKASPFYHGLYYTPRPTNLQLQDTNLQLQDPNLGYDQWFLAQDFPPQSRKLKILRRFRNVPSSTSEDDIIIELINAMECPNPKEDVLPICCMDLTRSSSSKESGMTSVPLIDITNHEIILSNNSRKMDPPVLKDNSQHINRSMHVYDTVIPNVYLKKNAAVKFNVTSRKRYLPKPHNNLQSLYRQTTSKGSFQSEYIEFLKRRPPLQCPKKVSKHQREPEIHQQFKPNNPCFKGSRFRLQRYLRQTSSSSHQIEPAPAHLPVTYLNPRFPFPAHQALPHCDTLWNLSNLLAPYQAISCNQAPIINQTQPVPQKYTQMPYVQIPGPHLIPTAGEIFPQSVHGYEKSKNPWLPQPKPIGNNSVALTYYPLVNNTHAHVVHLFK